MNNYPNLYYTGHTFTAESSELAVRLEDVRMHLRLDDLRQEDSYIIDLIKAQTMLVENWFSVALLNKTVVEYNSRFPKKCTDELWLGFAPVTSVTSVAYYDCDGNSQTWSSSEYTTRTTKSGTFIIPKPDYEYPTDLAIRPDAVVITYEAGFGAGASSVPLNVRLGITARVGRAYTNREDSKEQGISMSDVLLNTLKRY